MSIGNAEHLDPSFTGASHRPLLELGRGGMARVHLAERVANGLRKLVVLKILNPELAAEPEMRLAFRREAELCARLNHPNIVQVFEVLDEGTSPMMVMEYLEGVPFSEVIARIPGRLPRRLRVHVVMQVLTALHYFHEHKDPSGTLGDPVHRDISPSNVVVMHEGVVKVLDFGIAKVRSGLPEDETKFGFVKGKLRYMPAEQVSADSTIDRRADVFATGVMLWEAFAQRRMWEGLDNAQVFQALVTGVIPAVRQACPGISREWERIVNRAVAAHRDDRYPTALAMHEDMESSLGQLGGPVSQHELATFMKKEFGKWRAARQGAIDAQLALSTPAAVAPLVVQDASAVQHRPQASGAPREATRTLVATTPRRRRWPPLAILVTAAGALTAGAWMFFGAKPLGERQDVVTAPPSSSTALTDRRIQIAITAEPGNSVVSLDGKPLGKNPWLGQLDASKRLALVEATAPGCAPFRREVSLATDIVLQIHLEPLVAATPAPSTSSKARPPKKPPHHRANADCTIPYVLDADGVKTYRAECLSK